MSKKVKISGEIHLQGYSLDHGQKAVVPVFADMGHGADEVARATIKALDSDKYTTEFFVTSKVFDKLQADKVSFGVSGVVSNRENNLIKDFCIKEVSLIKE